MSYKTIKTYILAIVIGLFPYIAYSQDLSSGSLSGQSQAQQGAAQQSGTGYLDYVSGAKRPQTKNQIMTIDDFAGGLNSKGNPISLGKNEGQVVQNVRINNQLKSLSKRSPILVYGTASTSNSILGLFRYYAYNGTKVLLADEGNQILTGNDATGSFSSIFTLPQPAHKAQWLTWNNQAIMTDGFNAPVKYDGTSTSATYLGSLLATDSGTGTGPAAGQYTYQVSCYTNNSNSSGPFEFNFGTASNTLTATGHAVNLTMIPQCPDDDFLGEPIVGRYIYRTKAGGSTYFLLTTIANNSAVTFSDTVLDSSLSTLYPVIAGATVSQPPSGLLSLIYQGRLWVANNPAHPSRVYYSEINSQEMFLPDSFFDIRVNDGDQITMLADVLGIITIGKNNTIQKIYTQSNVTGQPQADWTISDPFAYVGCVSPYSVQNTPIGIMYLGNNGIYSFDGNFSTLLSDQVTPVISDISNPNFVNAYSAFYKNSYYLSYTSQSSGATTNNRVLVYDLLSKSFSIDTSNIGVFTVERGGNDIEVLYAGDSNTGKVYSYTNGTRDIINITQADFSGTFTNAWYLPVAGGGDPQNALLQIANTATIDALVGTIDSLQGTIQESQLPGTYVSPPYDVGAVSYNDIYWNETLPTAGSGVTFAVRAATADSAINSASWSQEYNNPSGSNLSANAAGNVIQYRITMTTDTLTSTPTVYSTNNYVVDLSYNISQGTAETTIPFEWQSGWMDFGAPAYKKSLRKIYVEYVSGGTGTMNITFNNYTGQSQTFPINLNTNPSEYIEYFQNGLFLGELFNIDITENSLNPLQIKRITIMYDVEPLV